MRWLCRLDRRQLLRVDFDQYSQKAKGSAPGTGHVAKCLVGAIDVACGKQEWTWGTRWRLERRNEGRVVGVG